MKHIQSYKIFENQEDSNHTGFPTTEEEIHKLCKEYGIRNYTINGDLSIDVDAVVNLNDTRLNYLPLNFNYVSGNFYCYDIGLKSLKGSPHEVGGFFGCSDNNLTSLEYAPNIVGGYFDCHNNELTTLKGCPGIIKGGFSCSHNKIISLKGCPEKVNGFFDCSHNILMSLKGCPERIKGSFNCSHNKIMSLKYLPNGFDYTNYLTSFDYNPVYTIINTFIKNEQVEDEQIENLVQEFNDYDIVRDNKVVLGRLRAFISDFDLEMPNLDEVKKYYTIV